MRSYLGGCHGINLDYFATFLIFIETKMPYKVSVTVIILKKYIHF